MEKSSKKIPLPVIIIIAIISLIVLAIIVAIIFSIKNFNNGLDKEVNNRFTGSYQYRKPAKDALLNMRKNQMINQACKTYMLSFPQLNTGIKSSQR